VSCASLSLLSCITGFHTFDMYGSLFSQLIYVYHIYINIYTVRARARSITVFYTAVVCVICCARRYSLVRAISLAGTMTGRVELSNHISNVTLR
jgi:hypothetical protein